MPLEKLCKFAQFQLDKFVQLKHLKPGILQYATAPDRGDYFSLLD